MAGARKILDAQLSIDAICKCAKCGNDNLCKITFTVTGEGIYGGLPFGRAKRALQQAEENLEPQKGCDRTDPGDSERIPAAPGKKRTGGREKAGAFGRAVRFSRYDSNGNALSSHADQSTFEYTQKEKVFL